jgi:hypothetical protein
MTQACPIEFLGRQRPPVASILDAPDVTANAMPPQHPIAKLKIPIYGPGNQNNAGLECDRTPVCYDAEFGSSTGDHKVGWRESFDGRGDGRSPYGRNLAGSKRPPK